ncbi:MAG TPA: hypothetical protein PLG41_08400 [Leptospiraceae bacterium]|nr:hypothetical protein [Leptospiraceae bacterium]
MQSIKPTKLEYQNALLKIKESGRDKIGLFGEALGLGIGTAGGAAVAGTVATVAGASTLLGSTTLGSVLGGIFVTSTPVGWVVGAAAAGGALSYAAIKLIKSGNKSDLTVKLNTIGIIKKIEEYNKVSVHSRNQDVKFEQIMNMLLVLYSNEKISQEESNDIVKGLQNKTIPYDAICEILKKKVEVI